MELEAAYPVVVTHKLVRVVFEAPWFAYLAASDAP
jgi:hypothetical protein